MLGPTQAEVDSIEWWHSFTFPNGVKARGGKGGDRSDEVLLLESQATFKYSVKGKTVLDVGAWNGYFCVEAVRRGAKRVVALDKPSWEHLQGYEGLELVRKYIAPSIESINRDVMDLRLEPVG